MSSADLDEISAPTSGSLLFHSLYIFFYVTVFLSENAVSCLFLHVDEHDFEMLRFIWYCKPK